jgi:hypothetical protein
MTHHEWKVNTPDGSRYYRADRFARTWTLKTTLKSEPDWHEIPKPWPLDDLRALRDVLWAKYHRKRISVEVYREIEQLLPAEEQRVTGELRKK